MAPADATPSNSSKKRKASELDDHSNVNGHKIHQSAEKSPSRKGVPKPNRIVEDAPFYLESPAKPASEESDRVKDVYRATDSPVGPELNITFTVKPGRKWSNMRAYRNVRLSSQTFTLGQLIYVNKTDPPPDPPPSDASDAELLEYDKANMWVGKIIQAKAESDKAVFVRVFWLYWPEELPMGRQPYHGDRELVMSNAMELLDAQTMASAAEVSYWDEYDDTSDAKQMDRYWRQTLDITKLGPRRRGGLSALRKHCRCDKEYNPDTTMYQCKEEKCGTWCHEECLVEEILKTAYDSLQKGTLKKDMDAKAAAAAAAVTEESGLTLGERIIIPAERFTQMVGRSVMNSVQSAGGGVLHEAGVGLQPAAAAAAPTEATPKKRPGKKPWDGKLEVVIDTLDAERVRASVKSLAAPAKSKKERKEEKQWTIQVNCLECGKPFD